MTQPNIVLGAGDRSWSRVEEGVVAKCQPPTFWAIGVPSFGDGLTGGTKFSLTLRLFCSSKATGTPEAEELEALASPVPELWRVFWQGLTLNHLRSRAGPVGGPATHVTHEVSLLVVFQPILWSAVPNWYGFGQIAHENWPMLGGPVDCPVSHSLALEEKGHWATGSGLQGCPMSANSYEPSAQAGIGLGRTLVRIGWKTPGEVAMGAVCLQGSPWDLRCGGEGGLRATQHQPILRSFPSMLNPILEWK